MNDDLLEYYERELAFLRRTGARFRKDYARVAARLQLEDFRCKDPHVELLLDGFAFLAARVHQRIDQDLPEISDALLGAVYPHHVRPIPSISVVEFELDPEQGRLERGFPIRRHTPLYSRTSGDAQCTFRTCYETTVWPVTVKAAGWVTPEQLRIGAPLRGAVAAFRLELQCLPGISFDELKLGTLRLFLNGEPELVHALYELLCNNGMSALARGTAAGVSKLIPLGANALQPVGFAPEHEVLPYSRRSFAGYRLLQEYFAFPEKYMFLDVAGFDRIRDAKFGDRVEIIVPIAPFERRDRHNMLERRVNQGTIRLGCTPAINLFERSSEPVLLTYRKPEYPVEPDRLRPSTEIFSIDDVVVDMGKSPLRRFEPFYSFRHGGDASDGQRFWHSTRRPRDAGWRPEHGSDVFISFVDLSGQLVQPDADVVTVRLTCFNGERASQLRSGNDPRGDFDMSNAGPVKRIRMLIDPTDVVRPRTALTQPPMGKSVPWQLISHLTLNYLSLTDDNGEALREILRLHNTGDTLGGRQQIDAIVGVETGRAYAPVREEERLVFARGQDVRIRFAEEQFAGAGVYLFASVLEQFLGLYASINSFVALTAWTSMREEPLRVWPARAGWKTLL